MITRYVQPRNKESVWSFLMNDPLALTYLDMPQPRSHPRDPHGNYLLEVEDLIARGETAAARRRLQSVYDAQAASAPAGERAAVTVLQETRLLLALGDSAAATTRLLEVLDNLQVAPTLLIDEPAQAASLVRAMALAAELAAARGDRAASRVWAARTIALWSGCDEPWQPLIRRMQALTN